MIKKNYQYSLIPGLSIILQFCLKYTQKSSFFFIDIEIEYGQEFLIKQIEI